MARVVRLPTFKPCYECIYSLRNALFEIKTKYCMDPYSIVSKFIKDSVPDLYTDSTNTERKDNPAFNIEHTVPLTKILHRRDLIKATELAVNDEPYHDPHLLFPTEMSVNTVRYDKSFADLHIDRSNFDTKYRDHLVLNKNKYYGNDSGILSRNISRVKKLTQLGNIDNDIYTCTDASCLFQPPRVYSGDIARIVFYVYLMYGIDPSVRPYTEHNPWLHQASTELKFCRGFAFDKFKEFFFDHIDDYYNWAKNDPIDLLSTDGLKEIQRNKTIMDKYCLPNIFVGYSDKRKCTAECYGESITDDKFYVNSSFVMIEDLFFGKEHDHDKYKNIEFVVKEPPSKKYRLIYSDTYGLIGDCKKTITDQNRSKLLDVVKKFKKPIVKTPNKLFVLPKLPTVETKEPVLQADSRTPLAEIPSKETINVSRLDSNARPFVTLEPTEIDSDTREEVRIDDTVLHTPTSPQYTPTLHPPRSPSLLHHIPYHPMPPPHYLPPHYPPPPQHLMPPPPHLMPPPLHYPQYPPPHLMPHPHYPQYPPPHLMPPPYYPAQRRF